MNVSKLIERARHSAFYLWLLNVGLQYKIPFNKPHGFRIVKIGEYEVKILIPYKRKNLNHIRGLHACALATVSEYATGLLLISNLGFDTYRMIMQRLEVDYHYQGKSDAVVEFHFSPEWLRGSIIEPLQTQESVVVPCEVKIHDKQGKHLTTAKIYWQIKKWASVRTKVSS
jgi:acyl-coenzyme A thioesterase PaaI-like protein